jgi:ABC-type Mn2+/Zn2+ transport system permease subunit
VFDGYLVSKAIMLLIGLLLLSNKDDQKTIVIVTILILLAVFLFWKDYLLESLLIAGFIFAFIYILNIVRNKG